MRVGLLSAPSTVVTVVWRAPQHPAQTLAGSITTLCKELSRISRTLAHVGQNGKSTGRSLGRL